MSDTSNIRLTEEELDNIVKYFESDREQVTEKFGYNEDADMYLQILKTFKLQILENQEIAERLRERKDYHFLCKGKFDSGSEMAKFHHLMWEEFDQIENG